MELDNPNFKEKIYDIIYEGYRLAWWDKKFPDGLEPTAGNITDKIIKFLKEKIK